MPTTTARIDTINLVTIPRPTRTGRSSSTSTRSASRSAPMSRSAATTAGSRSTRRPATPASRSRRRREGTSVGVQTGISLTTGDIDATHAELRAAGVDVDAEVSRIGEPVPPMFWFRDPDGNTLLIVEVP